MLQESFMSEILMENLERVQYLIHLLTNNITASNSIYVRWMN